MKNVLQAVVLLIAVWGCTDDALVGGDETMIGNVHNGVEAFPNAKVCNAAVLKDTDGNPIEGRFQVTDLEKSRDGSTFIIGNMKADDGAIEHFILKMNVDGTLLWEHTSDDAFYKLLPTSDGAVYAISSVFYNEADPVSGIVGAASAITYYDESGASKWAFALPAPEVNGEAVYPQFEVDAANRITAVGNFYDEVYLAPLFMDDPMMNGEKFVQMEGTSIGLYVAKWHADGLASSLENTYGNIAVTSFAVSSTDVTFIAGNTVDAEHRQVIISVAFMDVTVYEAEDVDIQLIALPSGDIMITGTYGPNMVIADSTGKTTSLSYPKNATGQWPFIARYNAAFEPVFAHPILNPDDESAQFDPTTGIIGVASKIIDEKLYLAGYNVEGTTLGYGEADEVVFNGEESALYFIASYNLDGTFAGAEGFSANNHAWTSAGFVVDNEGLLTYVDSIPTALDNNGDITREQLKVVSLCN